MSEIQQITEAIFGDTPLRTGYSESAEASYIVAADIKGAMRHGGSTHMFLQGLEAQQEAAGQAKGSNIVAPLYVGTEVVQTAGGPQRMKVVYKRGVFQLLMLSRKPEATQYRDKVFDVLERIEREGFFVKENATIEQLREAHAALAQREADMARVIEGAKSRQEHTDAEVRINEEYWKGRLTEQAVHTAAAHEVNNDLHRLLVYAEREGVKFPRLPLTQAQAIERVRERGYL